MRVADAVARAFEDPGFQDLIERFLRAQKLIPEDQPPGALSSRRFLSRSVAPHVEKLSELFNRQTPESESAGGVDTYWRKSANPANFRQAYFLSFMPGNLFRALSVFAELARLGFRWHEPSSGYRLFRAIEYGAGPASGACGVGAAAKLLPELAWPEDCEWTLVERDRAVLGLGHDWASRFFSEWCSKAGWRTRELHRTIDWSDLAVAPGKFDLLLFSFALNESRESPEFLARSLLNLARARLEEEGLLVLVEPALKLQSRRLLEIRRAILESLSEGSGVPDLQILTPCLGSQACGALADPEDWCHEEVTWWRPPYLRLLDELTRLDRKSLPFTHQVWIRSKRPRAEILPALASGAEGSPRIHRLVSPARAVGRDQEFFLCGDDGKRRARLRDGDEIPRLARGDLLLDAELRGDPQATRVESISRALVPDPR